ncbi:MAG: serine O-acetyltransferase [Janthinobacterium lividum]
MSERARSHLRKELDMRDHLNRWWSTFRTDLPLNPHWEPRTTLAIWRLGQATHDRPGAGAFVLRRAHSVLDGIWVRAIIGAELPRSVPAGPRLRLPHSGRGVVLHPSSRLGSDVTLYHGVTLGVSGGDLPPVVEDGSYLGAGAKIIGNITVGAGAKVGANAVVVRDVPTGATAVGVPARILPTRRDTDSTLTRD